ncbi:unnamed protein product [Caenorhabditis nigoni]
MEAIPEFLKNNDHYLKSCILYEVAQKKPIFDSYRTFCDTVGQDAMEYWDFEFWYNRFCKGELDFDYHRSKDPVSKKLMDMPVNLVRKIAENLETVERSALRSVNRAIKNVADSFLPIFESMSITWRGPNFLMWKYNDNPTIHYGDGKLEKLSNLPGFEVHNLLLRGDGIHAECKLSDVLPVSFMNAKNVDISTRTINEATQLLSIVNPGNLESIRLWPVIEDNLSGFFHTEQFKKAENVEIMSLKGFHKMIISNFSHLKSFKIKLSGDFLEEDFWRIREMISTFENLEKCELRIVNSENQLQIRTVAKAIGAEGPITEELVFRACSTTLMYHVYGYKFTLFWNPVPFAASHFHHIWDDQRKGYSLAHSILQRGFQFVYTYIFGCFATYLQLTTKHAMVPIIAHTICNAQGLPMWLEIANYPKRRDRITLYTAYIAGFAGFGYLLYTQQGMPSPN